MGRWLSQAFLAHMRPQVIEWTNNMSRDMICHDTFADASGFDMADPEIMPESRRAVSMVPMTPSSFHHST